VRPDRSGTVATRPSLAAASLLAAVVVFSVFAPTPLAAADWPQWRGPGRDGLIPTLAARSWPQSLKPGWKVGVGIGHSSPVVVGDRVFQFSRDGDNEVLEARELAGGKPVWRQAYPASYTMNMAALSHGKGPKSTPVVDAGRVFTLGISGILSAFDAASGRVLWRKEYGAQFKETSPLYGAAMSPVVDQGRLIVHVGGSGQGALLALDPATGATLWAREGDGPGYSSPVVGELAGIRQVVTFVEAGFLGLSADKGEVLWRMPFSTSYVQNAITPILAGGLVVYSGLDHPVRALRVTKKGTAYAAEPAWENAEVANYMSTPVLVGQRLFGLSHKKKGQFFCLDLATGKTVWLSEGRQGENASLLAGGGVVVALTTDSELLVLDAAAPAFKVVARYSVASSPVWAHPVVLPDGVVVKDTSNLALLKF
jgi:outer membrane protein assembly factor BamB